MLAYSLARRIPGCVVAGDGLADWGLPPRRLPLPARHLRVGGHRVDVARLAYLLGAGLVDGIETDALGCRMELLDPVERVRRLFAETFSPGPGYGKDVLVLNVRAAEILGPRHADYRPLPLAYYERLIAETALRPVFLGQLGDDAYTAALRARFVGAEFVPSRGAMVDFGVLRASRHIAVAISTFSWLAAWLSRAETIHLPVAGMFHPGQRPEVDLLPIADARYRFHLFPVHRWGGSDAEMVEVISGGQAGRRIEASEALSLVQPSVVLSQKP